MKVGIVGGRDFIDARMFYYEILQFLTFYGEITQVISGGACGADTLAEKWSKDNNVPFIVFKPDWKKFGKAAGFMRNSDIVKESEFVIAFWDGKSKGTKDTINKTKELKIPLKIVRY